MLKLHKSLVSIYKYVCLLYLFLHPPQPLCVKDAISVSGSVMPSRLRWGMMFLQGKAPMDGESLP